MAFLDSEAMGPGAAGSSVKPLNTLASIIEITADGYLDGHGAPGNSGPPSLLSELDALGDELSKMKKRKSHHYAGSTGLGASHLGS